MSVDIKIGKNVVTDKVAGYTVSEESTPTDPSDMTGGVGQITLELEDSRDARHARFREVELVDTELGKTLAKTTAGTGNGFARTLTADSKLINLVGERSVGPFVGKLGDLFRAYFEIVNLGPVVIDPSIYNRPAAAIGWKGSVWDSIKRLCASHAVEVALVSNIVNVRPVRQRIAVTKRDISVQPTENDQQIAQSVVINYMEDAVYGTGLAFPLGGWHEDVQVFSVDAAETVEFEIDLKAEIDEFGASLEYIEQPICVDYVAREEHKASTYCVAGNDGKPITARQWLDTGGKVETRIGDDAQTLVITVTGSAIAEYAPYRIAATSGDGNYYSSLRLLGDGIFYERRQLTLLTGNDADRAPTEVGAEVDSPFIFGYEEAWRAGMSALSSWTGPNLTLSATTKGINRVGDSGSLVFPSGMSFNAEYEGYRISDFNEDWEGKSLQDFDDYFLSQLENEFENQAFGNIAGARVETDSCWMRIRSASISPLTVSYEAVNDTTCNDWNEHYKGMTWNDLNALLPDDWTIGDLGLEPLVERP